MNKLIAALTTSSLMAVGLVGFSGGTAEAKPCPYTGCFDTDTDLRGQRNYSPGDRPKVRVRVDANGNAQPKGRILFRVKKLNGDYFRQKSFFYDGGWESYTLKPLNGPGRYRITAIYKAGPNRPFRSSDDSMGIRVRR